MKGYSCVRIPLPVGLVKSGRISNPSSLSPLIAQAMLAARPTPIKGNQVVIGLPEEQVFIKIIELPNKLKAKEIETVLEYQWQNLIPIARDQVYFDSLILPHRGKKHDTQQLLIAAYPQDIIDSLVITLSQINVIPRKIMPISFGAANLYGGSPNETVLVAMSEFGQDVTVSLVRDRSARFSTTIHAPVTSQTCLKQLSNIKSFYEKNVAREGEVISSSVILPSPYSAALAQHAGGLSLPVTIASARTLIASKEDDTALGPLLPLIGTLKTPLKLSILPRDMVQNLQATIQKSILRTILSYTTLTFILLLYFSLIFYGSLHVNNKTKIRYAPAVTAKVNEETEKVNAAATAYNQVIDHIASLAPQRTHAAAVLATLQVADEQATDVTLTNVSVQGESGAITIRLDGTRTDPTAPARLADLIKKNPLLADTRVETVPPTNPSDPNAFSLTLTKAGSL